MYLEWMEPGINPGTEAPLVFTFFSCEAMLTACVKAFGLYGRKIHKSALYYLYGQYRLILYPYAEPGEQGAACAPLLCEYAAFTKGGELAAAYVAEHGQPIAEEHAIDKISYYLA